LGLGFSVDVVRIGECVAFCGFTSMTSSLRQSAAEIVAQNWFGS